MNYNMELYNNLTSDSIKHAAVIILLFLIFLYALVKFYNKVYVRRKTSYANKEKLDELKKDMDEMLNKNKD